MKDTIYREDAINAFDCSIGGVPVDSVKYVSEYADKMMSRINALPPAEPERKKGVWINDCCSICGYGVEPWNNTPYCPNCGADMRGE